MLCERPYRGDDHYIFVTYSHHDASEVMPVIRRLIAEGYRVWYDEGLMQEDKWAAEIQSRISDCTACMVFLSDSATKSDSYSVNEIMFLLRKKKPMLPIYLSETKIGEELAELATIQGLNKYEYENDDKFYEKLFELLNS